MERKLEVRTLMKMQRTLWSFERNLERFVMTQEKSQ